MNETAEERALSFLGLCMRAGQVVSGQEACVAAIRGGECALALLDAGALDVFTESIQMKKNRPGTLLTCLCPEGESEKFAHMMLLHTTTRGVRRSLRIFRVGL